MIKRYFPPATFRSTFSPERTFQPPPLAFKTTFPLEGFVSPSTCESTSNEDHILGPPIGAWHGDASSRREWLISKPKGEVNRSDTYNLKEFCEAQLGWSGTHFEEIQVG